MKGLLFAIFSGFIY